MSDTNQEPTMDDILASIRRIIAEDDGVAPAKPVSKPQTMQPETAQVTQSSVAPVSMNSNMNSKIEESKPVDSFSAVKMADSNKFQDDEDDDVLVLNKAEEVKPEPVAVAKPSRPSLDEDVPPPTQQQRPVRRTPSLEGLGLESLDDLKIPSRNARPSMRPTPIQRMDRTQDKVGLERVFSDERILSATTESLGTASFASLERAVRMGKAGDTLEDVVRNLLRPMLRSWIDQNLPSLVERMVQSEIQKIVSGARRNWDDSDTL